MSKTYQYIIENAASGKIDRQIAVEIVKRMKSDELIPPHEMAIIGIAVNLPGGTELEGFWHNLRNGVDLIGEFPAQRKKDLQGILPQWNTAEMVYNDGAYLPAIDKFDPAFFRLSPKEASLMDPNQRLFLQTVWRAIEDSGYGGKKLAGSRTGIYVGYSSDFGVEYKSGVQSDPEQVTLSIPGNIHSIIASRIAYLLDLKGPSMVVDTACSSALVAVHLACQGLRNRECDYAIAGGVKINLAPLKGLVGVGVESPTGRAKTFDDSADGTALGEGVVAILLKPLEKARNDRDQIYAVIKGSAVNQDGNSIGITAPNALAQAEVIERAWKDAGVEPESISYIEAHGTGTRLGDPIEVEGITRAFRKYTAKKQFCGIGSVKTNLGHLDHAAGLAGLIKAVLALQKRELPPSLHFHKPNQKIPFADSPVYVVDHGMSWLPKGTPLRCGVSSFGLSGTNCHMILEEAPAVPDRSIPEGPFVLTVSGKSYAVLKRLCGEYHKWVSARPAVNPANLCYTANTGRGHYTHRLAIIFQNVSELLLQLEEVLSSPDLREQKGDLILYGEHKVVTVKKEQREAGELTEDEKRQLTYKTQHILEERARWMVNDLQTRLRELCQLYVQGADLDWEAFYAEGKHFRISTPTYSFEEQRCWVEPKSQKGNKAERAHLHPLLDRILAESVDRDIYSTSFSVDRHWELREHRVTGHYVLPGTTYVEMGRAVAKKYYPTGKIRLKDIIFLAPFSIQEGESKEIQTIVKKEQDVLEYLVVSRVEGEEVWVTHAKGTIQSLEHANPPTVDLAERLQQCPEELHQSADFVRGAIETGPRWRNLKHVYIGVNELIIQLELPREFTQDLTRYGLHPALLDIAVNAANQSAGTGLYLPFSYKTIELYGPMPGTIYSHLRKKGQLTENQETVTFDITLMDSTGQVFAEIEDYTIKKVHEADLKIGKDDIYYQMGWMPMELHGESVGLKPDGVLIFMDEKGLGAQLAEHYRHEQVPVVEVTLSTTYQRLDQNQYQIGSREEDYIQLISEVKEMGINQILHLQTITQNPAIHSLEDLRQTQIRGVESLFYLTRALQQNRIREEVEIVLLAETVHEVTGLEEGLSPHHASLFGFGKVIHQEYPQLICRTIDLDPSTTASQLLAELECRSRLYQVAYRAGQRFVEEFRRVDLKSIPEERVEIKAEGVYLITGGTGSLGLEMGKYLAAQNRVNLALLHRSEMPAEAQWEEILRQNDDARLCHKIRAIREMQGRGAEVRTVQADVANLKKMETVLQNLRAAYGRINGIIHCAGVAGDGFIIRKSEETLREVLAPKVEGTWVLDRLTEHDQLDCFVNFSSIMALFGGVGQSDYTAANSYLDAFAAARNRLGKRTLTMDWPAWKEIGMAHDFGYTDEHSIFKAISTSLGVQAFDRIFHRRLPVVIVGELNYSLIPDPGQFPMNLSSELKIAINRRRIVKSGSAHEESKQVRQVQVKGKESGFSDVEMKLATIWARVLGVEEVNIYESFFELGGDSILATHLLAEVEKEFPGMVDITDIFNYVTIAEIAQCLNQKMGHGEEGAADEMDEILEQLMKGQISMDEADNLLNLRRES